MPMPSNNQWIYSDTTEEVVFTLPPSSSSEVGQQDLFGNSMQEAVENIMNEHAEAVEEDTREIKESLILEPTGYPVEVYAIAFSKTGRKNSCQKISCRNAKPLGSWCYDLRDDQFLVDCAGYQHLGRFSLGYKARMKNIEGWEVDIPLSLSVIEKRISSRYKGAFEEFKKHYPEKDHTYSFIQCGGVFNG